MQSRAASLRAYLGAASFALGCVWLLLWPLVSVASGEAKPRSLFLSEKAVIAHATPRFSSASAARALALRQRLGTAAARDGASASGIASLVATACRELALDAEIQEAPHGLNVVCSVPARGISRGYEYLLLSTGVAAGPAATNSSSALTAAVALTLASELVHATWLAKDLVVLVTVYSAASASGAAAATQLDELDYAAVGGSANLAETRGLEAFFRAHDFDGVAEAHRAAVRSAWRSADALRYLSLRFGDRQSPMSPPQRMVMEPGGVTIRPLQQAHGLLRAALHLQSTPAVAGMLLGDARTAAAGSSGDSQDGIALGLSITAPGSRMPELDYTALLTSALPRHNLRVVVGDAAAPPGHSHDSPLLAADRIVAHWTANGLLSMQSSAGQAVLLPLLHGVAAPISQLLRASPRMPVAADAYVYLQRLSSAVRMLLRMLIGPFAPHAVAVRRGVPAVTVVLGAPGDFLYRSEEAVTHPGDCAVLSPCIVSAAGLRRERSPVVTADPSASPPLSVQQHMPEAAQPIVADLGYGLERVLRAMSGTDERLHASLPSYVLLSPVHFVGLVELLLPAAFLHAPLLIALLATTWPPRAAVLEEAAVCVLLVVAAVGKLALCLLAGMPGWPGLHSLPAALLSVDMVVAGGVAPYLRRWTARQACCAAPVSAQDDAAALQLFEGTAPPAVAAAPGALQQRASVTPPPALAPAVLFAWLGLGLQQLPLMYVDYALFLASTLALVPPLMLLSWLARRPGAAAPPPLRRAALLLALAGAYSLVSPAGWQLLLGAAAARHPLQLVLALLRRSGTLHAPVLLHAQALLCLIASSQLR